LGVSEKSKIFLVVTGLEPGGAERQVVDLADQFIRLGFEVIIVVLSGCVVISPQLESVNIINLSLKKTPMSILSCLLKLRFLIADHNPTVVHSHMYHANIFCRLVKMLGINFLLVNSAHSSNEGGRVRMLSYRYTSYLCDFFTNVGADAVESFIARGAARRNNIFSVRNGINLENYHVFTSEENLVIRKSLLGVMDADCFIFMIVARLAPEKNLFNALDAVIELSARVNNFKLFIVGSGPLLEELKSYSRTIDVEKYVEFMGYRSDVSQLLGGADSLILSSDYEGLPISVGEAMASGLPVVSTECGGVSELVPSEFLVPVRDPVALAHTMYELMALSNQDRKRIGFGNRRIMEKNFSLKSIAELWIDTYKKIGCRIK
jgi:glycosyltransferase involved in cell wall biosynthesis